MQWKKGTIQRNWQHRVHNTTRNKTNTQRNMCWTPLYAKINIKYRKKKKIINTPYTQIHAAIILAWYRHFNKENGGVKLVLWAKIPLLVKWCEFECAFHVSFTVSHNDKTQRFFLFSICKMSFNAVTFYGSICAKLRNGWSCICALWLSICMFRRFSDWMLEPKEIDFRIKHMWI